MHMERLATEGGSVEQPQEDKQRWTLTEWALYQNDLSDETVMFNGSIAGRQITVVPERELLEAKERIAELGRQRDKAEEEARTGPLVLQAMLSNAGFKSVSQLLGLVGELEGQLQKALDLLEAILSARLDAAPTEQSDAVESCIAFLRAHGRLTEGDSQ